MTEAPQLCLLNIEDDEVPCQDEYSDRSPHEVCAVFPDRGEYLCSARTMYRIPDGQRAVRERRSVRNHPSHPVPRLVATAPNQLRSRDITRLPGPHRTSYSLSVVMDNFSRHVVAWLVAEKESANFATRLIGQAVNSAGIDRDQLTGYADLAHP